MTKPTTVYLDPRLLQAVKMKAVQSGTSVSRLVDEALRLVLREDEADLEVLRKRKNQPVISFEAMLKKLKKDGLL